MPKGVYQNPGVLESITRPVVLEISRQVLEMTGLPKDLQIQYPGDSGVMFEPGSQINGAAEFNNFTSKSQLFIVVEETYQQDRLLSTAVYQGDAPIIFEDPESHVYLREVYSPTDLALSITYRATDRDSAIRWRNDIRTRVSMNREVRVHQISYSYFFDEQVMLLLAEIQALQEKVAPYNRTFQDYLITHFDSRARQMSTLTGKQLTWGMAETQGRVIGYFDFEGEPEDGSKVDGNASWTISFTYKVKFDKPIATVIDYPIMVHNQLLNLSMIPAPVKQIEDVQTTYSVSSGALAHFEVYRRSQYAGMKSIGYTIPDFDDFRPDPSSILPDTLRIATMLTSLDTSPTGDPLLLLDLKNLGTYQIDPVIRNFMVGEAQYLNLYGNSILNITVYEGEVMMNPANYYVDNQLNVRLRSPGDLRKIYHVKFSLFLKPQSMPSAAKERLRTDCRSAMILLPVICRDLVKKNILKTCLINNTVPRLDWSAAMNYLDIKSDYLDYGSYVQFNTVMTLAIVAERSN